MYKCILYFCIRVYENTYSVDTRRIHTRHIMHLRLFSFSLASFVAKPAHICVLKYGYIISNIRVESYIYY